MGFLENLKTFAEAKFKLRLDFLNNLTIGKKTNINVTVNLTGDVNAKPMEVQDQTLNIGLRNLPVEETKQVHELLRDALQKEGVRFIENKAEKVVEDIIENENVDEIQKVLNKLRPYLPSKDIAILRASLYLRKIFKSEGEGKSSGTLKQQIMLRHGDRGRKIANLCTAEYFHEQIIPLLDQMQSAPNFVLEDFLRVYNTIIDEHGFAVFLVASWTEEQMLEAIKKKISANLKYGLRYIHIHVIGNQAVKKAQAAVAEMLASFKKIVKESEKVTGNVLYMKLIFDATIAEDLNKELL